VRWITHICAPTFVLLAGASARLQRSGNRTAWSLSHYLLTRGLWLIALEFTVLAFGFNFAVPFAFVHVIWAIGFSMIVLAALVHLPARAVLAIGLVIIVGHQVLAPFDAVGSGVDAVAWRLLMEPGPASFWPGVILYPAVPWLGIMCVGYGLGSVFLLPQPRQDKTLLVSGAILLSAFLVVRALNGYGDPRTWTSYDAPMQTVMSFMNVSKYPPSLSYVLATLGVASIGASFTGRVQGLFADVLLAFGRTPLFTYIIHIYVVHGSAMLLAVMLGFPPFLLVNFLGDTSRAIEAGWGVGLTWVFVIWLSTVALLYPLSRWFASIKRRRRDWWLSYL